MYFMSYFKIYLNDELYFGSNELEASVVKMHYKHAFITLAVCFP